jgi:hypothetical protein
MIFKPDLRNGLVNEQWLLIELGQSTYICPVNKTHTHIACYKVYGNT